MTEKGKIMKKIALCGPSGVGKGYISSIITEKFGFPVLDTDALVHEMYRSDDILISELGNIFGEEIIKDGEINRKALREIVFFDRKALEKLNRTVHKRVFDYTVSWFSKMENEGFPLAFADIPQIIESGMTDFFDIIIGITAPLEVRIKRIISRDGISREDAIKRIENQLTPEEYVKICRYTINNDGNSDSILPVLYEIINEVNTVE